MMMILDKKKGDMFLEWAVAYANHHRAVSWLAAFICFYSAVCPKYCQGIKSRMMRLAGHVTSIAEKRTE
jgi:hypothetical protein